MLIPFILAAGAIVGCGAETAPRQQFTEGRQALTKGDYQTAIRQLTAYLGDGANGKLASRASFLIAKAQLGLGNYEKSRQQFEATIRKYPNSAEAHKSRYKLGMLSLLEGDAADARKRFEELTANPSGPLTPEAAAMLRFLDRQRAAARPEAD